MKDKIGQYQVVIGNEVSNLFKEFKSRGFGDQSSASASKEPQGNILQRLVGFIAGYLTPLLPAMLCAGMLKVVLTLCTTVGIMDASGSAYQIFYAVSDAFYYFLPVFLGWSIAQKVGGSIPLFMSLGAMLCYPSLVTLMGGAVEGIEYGTFLGSQCTYLLSAVSWDW